MCQSDGKIILCLRHHRNFLLKDFFARLVVKMCANHQTKVRVRMNNKYNHEKKIFYFYSSRVSLLFPYIFFVWDARSNEDLFEIFRYTDFEEDIKMLDRFDLLLVPLFSGNHPTNISFNLIQFDIQSAR